MTQQSSETKDLAIFLFFHFLHDSRLPHGCLMTAAMPDIACFHINVKRKRKKKYFYLGFLFKRRKAQSPSTDYSSCLIGQNWVTWPHPTKHLPRGMKQPWLAPPIRITCWKGDGSCLPWRKELQERQLMKSRFC